MQTSKKRKHDSMFVRRDPILQQSVTIAKAVTLNTVAAAEDEKVPCSRSRVSRSTLLSLASQPEPSPEKTGRLAQLDDIDKTRDPRLPSDAYNMDADDEDSHPVHKPRYRALNATIPHRYANHHGAPLGTHPLHSRPAENVAPHNHTRHSHDPVEKDFAVPESPLHDITNMSYAGAVDSQGNSWQNGLDDPKGGEGSYLGDSERNSGPRAPAGTQGETQFSGGSQSWQGATYQSYRPPATGLNGVPFTAVTSTNDRPASFALQHDLPILNVKSLSLISDLRDGVTDHPHASGLDLLAVIFEGGELKDIPRRRNEKTGMFKGHVGNLRLCNIKICQPNPYGGHPKMMVMDVTVWGDMAEQVASGDYRLVKGDVVWLKSTLQSCAGLNGFH